jgi:hypothetical protein
MKINPDIVNDVTYRHAKFHYKILCIVIYTKIIKSDEICILKYTYSDLHICHFCVAQTTKHLNLIFCTFVEQIVGYNIIFVSNFFDTQIYDCHFF